MDYYALAEELMQLRVSSEQIQLERSLSCMTKGELFVLNYLYSHQKVAYPKELSKSMLVSTARIAAILNHLQKNGYIERTTDPRDNRQIIVTLTKAGEQMVKGRRAETLQVAVDFLRQLGPEDAAEYIRLQRKIMSISL
ncbi:MAG: transcriptional regulator [Oscillospiraceae bacterium]|nr:transcriptional regulator [Oscillospiraceae bacterium]